jgi:hypothetical protein
MPAAFVFRVDARSGLAAGTWAGPALHAIFLGRVRLLDEALAQRLHDDRGPKTYALSDLLPDGAGGLLWRWVALDEPTREIMLALALMGPWRMMPLGVPHDVRWEPNHPWAGAWTYEALRAAEGRKRRYELVFPTTTSFKVDGEPTALPTPRLLLASALQRWNCHAPFQLAPELANLIDPLVRVEAAEVRPSRVRAGDKWVRGFTGRMTVTLSRRASPELGQVGHCLLMYLMLCGAGVKTAMGLGLVVPPLPARSPKPMPARREVAVAPTPVEPAASLALPALPPASLAPRPPKGLPVPPALAVAAP